MPASTDALGAAIGDSIAYPNVSGASNFTVNQVVTVSGVGRSSGFVIGVGLGTNAFRSLQLVGVYLAFVRCHWHLRPVRVGVRDKPRHNRLHPPRLWRADTRSTTFTGIMVVASSPNAVTQVTDELTAAYGNNIRTTSVSSLLSSIQSVTSGTSTLLEAVAGTSVLVAFIGIMTTMLTSVLERTKEIGVLKALGSSSSGIMLVFLTEAVVTGLIGGFIGAGAGYMLSFLVIGALSGTLSVPGFGGGGAGSTTAATSGRGGSGASFGAPAASSASSTLTITPAITPEIIILAIVLAVAVGTFGGLIPAWRASRLNPVEALRRS